MFKKHPISMKKAIELEKWILDNTNSGMTLGELNNMIRDNFNADEQEYLIEAFLIPMIDVIQIVSKYENGSNSNILQMVGEIQKKYNTTRNIVMKRIQYMRRIGSYIEDYVTVYDKLVRDNIPDIIKNNGDEPIYRILEDDEYLDYLYKKDSEELEEVKKCNTKEEVKKELADKLEIIKTLASYYGYSLEDIIEEADNKVKKNGAFNKRILLIRTINKK